MSQPHWPEKVDAAVKQARFGAGDTFWESAESLVESGHLSDDLIRYFATVGLAEIVTQEHRVDRDRLEPCIGDLLVKQRWPELDPGLDGDSA